MRCVATATIASLARSSSLAKKYWSCTREISRMVAMRSWGVSLRTRMRQSWRMSSVGSNGAWPSAMSCLRMVFFRINVAD